MKLAKNKYYLRNHRDILNELSSSTQDDNLFIVKSKSGINTAYIKEKDKKQYLHSLYDPIKEAEIIADSYNNIKDGEPIIFYGTGLGYHVEEILRRNPNSDYYIYEPRTEIMNLFLNNIELERIRNKIIGITVHGKDMGINIFDLLENPNKKLNIILLPSHIRIYDDTYNSFNNLVVKTVKEEKSSVNIDYALQRNWLINGMVNFNRILEVPNILINRKIDFKNKVAIIAAAGPSLDQELDNLRKINYDKSAYVFSVGSSINTLINNDIRPTAVVSYDPKLGNKKVIQIIKDKGIEDIPLIFGSTVGNGTIDDYPGEQLYFINSQDTVSRYYLEGLIKEDTILSDSATVAVMTLQLLIKLGFSKIILVGQNLGYIDNKRHSKDIVYSDNLTEEELNNALEVESVNGDLIKTNESMIAMKKQYEFYIENNPQVKVINTTQNGAKIEGTEFMNLSDVMDRELEKGIVDDNWYKIKKPEYKRYLSLDKNDKMTSEYEKLIEYMKNIDRILNELERKIKKINIQEISYEDLDNYFNKIENNKFYQVFIKNIIRVQYKLFRNNVKKIKYISDPIKKGTEVLKTYKQFLMECLREMNNISDLYFKMDFLIREYINEDNN